MRSWYTTKSQVGAEGDKHMGATEKTQSFFSKLVPSPRRPLSLVANDKPAPLHVKRSEVQEGRRIYTIEIKKCRHKNHLGLPPSAPSSCLQVDERQYLCMSPKTRAPAASVPGKRHDIRVSVRPHSEATEYTLVPSKSMENSTVGDMCSYEEGEPHLGVFHYPLISLILARTSF